jgi:nucleotide-binding universal stress UspA family protein
MSVRSVPNTLTSRRDDDQVTVPFRRVLVPYDGSEPADRALSYGIAIARTGASLDVVHAVDESVVIAQATTTVNAFDPTNLIDVLDRQGRAFLAVAHERALAVGIDAATKLIHARPIPGILSTAEECGDELIVLGTHARTGLPRTFLGSTAEGVLRLGTIPVLAIRALMPPPREVPFRKVLVAVDESDAGDAAAAWASVLARTVGTHCMLCNVVDTRVICDAAAAAGYDPGLFGSRHIAEARSLVESVRVREGLASDAAETVVVEDEPAAGIISTAIRGNADAILMGSHGRRGLARVVLGSVAEQVLRHSPLPVFVARVRPHDP